LSDGRPRGRQGDKGDEWIEAGMGQEKWPDAFGFSRRVGPAPRKLAALRPKTIDLRDTKAPAPGFRAWLERAIRQRPDAMLSCAMLAGDETRRNGRPCFGQAER
jgi:hypothetical protein